MFGNTSCRRYGTQRSLLWREVGCTCNWRRGL
nr:MAG TPA: hypothetical protein [Caudoviricetes sp.]